MIENYGTFEERIKRRAIDRRLVSIRAALDARRRADAAAELGELIALNPDLPEIPALTAELDRLRRPRRSNRRLWMAAAITATVVLIGYVVSQLPAPDAGVERPEPATVGRNAAVVPSPVAAGPAPAATIGRADQESDQSITSEADTVSEVRPLKTPETPPSSRPSSVSAPTPLRLARPPESVAPNPATPNPATASGPIAVTPVAEPPATPVADLLPPDPIVNVPTAPVVSSTSTRDEDVALAELALQRYRRAYEGLDARSAQAVYPTVNESALARAFDGLISQTITFERCDVEVEADLATAACRGSASYVPKVGSREPHTEPRVWNFRLHKAAGEWRIDSAQVARP